MTRPATKHYLCDDGFACGWIEVSPAGVVVRHAPIFRRFRGMKFVKVAVKMISVVELKI